MEPPKNQPGFLARLKQHRLYGVVVVYAIVSWVLTQLVNSVLPDFGLSRAAVPVLIIVLLSGFPVALVLAWMLIQPKDPAQYSSWQRLHWKLGAALSVAVVILVVVSGFYTWRLAQRHVARVMAVQAAVRTPAFNPPADSLVVLPFTNMSADSRQQYFSDGITEELTNVLGQIPALRVIAWDTASKYRGSLQSATDIGKTLNVANLVHGSIERDGDRVRITAELVDTRSNYQIWSQHYDDEFANIFRVQDQVSEAIANALKVEFAQTSLPVAGTNNPQAHERVLRGRALLDKFDARSHAAAQKQFQQAIKLDPGYAEAHALLARTLLDLTERSDLPLKQVLPRIRQEAQTAMALDSRNADSWVALGDADASTNPPDIAKARREFQRALELDPSNAVAHVDYGNTLPLRTGFAEYQEATLLDPANETAWNNLAEQAQDLGDWAQDVQASETLLKLDPQDVDSAFGLAFAYQQLKQYAKMIAVFAEVKPATRLDQQQVAAGRLAYQAVQNPKLHAQALAKLKKLARHVSNQDVAGNLLQLYLVLGETTQALKLLQHSCPSDPIGCSDLAVNPIYRPLHSNPDFEALSKKYTTATVD